MAPADGSSFPGAPVGSRYDLVMKLATGGMATVYIGRLRAAAGFWRLVAIKRAHPHLLESPSFRRQLVDEARLASKLHHPHVVAVQDVEELAGELLLVMDYVEGVSLSQLVDAVAAPLPAGVALRIVLDACAGLHAAHTLADEDGAPVGLVHRDVSPHNILVGVDGLARIADFGIAKSVHASRSATGTGVLKGKFAYMAPEYVDRSECDARSDVFSLAVVLWEALAGERLFRADTETETMKRVLTVEPPALASRSPALAPLDAVLSIALAKNPAERFATADAFATALEQAGRACGGSHREVARLLQQHFAAELDQRRRNVRAQLDGAGIEDRETVEVSGTRSVEKPAAALSAESSTFAHSNVSRLTPTARPARGLRLAIGLAAIAAGGLIAWRWWGDPPEPAPAAASAEPTTAQASGSGLHPAGDPRPELRDSADPAEVELPPPAATPAASGAPHRARTQRVQPPAASAASASTKPIVKPPPTSTVPPNPYGP